MNSSEVDDIVRKIVKENKSHMSRVDAVSSLDLCVREKVIVAFAVAFYVASGRE